VLLNDLQIIHILFYLKKSIPKVTILTKIGPFETKKTSGFCNDPGVEDIEVVIGFFGGWSERRKVCFWN